MKRNRLVASAAAALLALACSFAAVAAPSDEERPAAPAPARGAVLGLNIGTPEQQDRAEGVEVISVRPGGPAEAAGIRAGDVIVAVDGKALRRSDAGPPGRTLVEHMRGVQPGQVVRVDVLRDGRRQAISVTAAAAEPPFTRLLRQHVPMLDGMQLPPEVADLFGGPARGMRSLQLVPVTPKLGQYFGTDRGLLVVRAPQLPDAALEEGDVVLAIGGRTPDDPRHAMRILGSYQPGEKVKVDILRQRKRMTVELQMPTEDDVPRAGSAPRTPPPPPPPPPQPTSAATISS